MKLAIRRPSYRVATLMILVALSAIVFAGVRARARWIDCEKRAARHAEFADRFVEARERTLCVFGADLEEEKAKWAQMAAYHSTLSRQYHRLAMRPWLLIPPEPPPPDPELVVWIQELIDLERRSASTPAANQTASPAGRTASLP